MKALAGAIVVLSLFLMSILLTYFTGFYNLGGGIDVSFWKIVPSFPPYPRTLVCGQSLILMTVVAGMGVGLLRGVLKRSYLAVSIFCLVYGIVPYVVGQILWPKNGIGQYLAMMLLGPLYAVIFSLFFAGLHLWKASFKKMTTPQGVQAKALAGAIIVLNLFLMSLLVTHITMFCNLGGEKDVSFWNLYPSLPPILNALCSGDGFILMAIIAGIEVAFLRGYLKRSYLIVSIFCLVSGFIPYLVGTMFMFRNLGGDSSAIGRWLGMILDGPLYAMIFSLFFAAMYLWTERSRNVKKPFDEKPVACLSTSK